MSKQAAAHRTVEAVWRIESARLIAALARVTGDVGLAEDLAQDALVAVLEISSSEKEGFQWVKVSPGIV